MGDSPRVGPWWHVYTQLLQLFFTCLTNFLPSPVITGLSGTPKRDFGVVSCPFCHRWLMPAGKNLPLRLYRCWFTIGGNGLRRHSLDAGLSDVSAVLLMAIPAAAYGTICNLSLWAVGAVGRREVCFCRPSTGVYRSVRPWHFSRCVGGAFCRLSLLTHVLRASSDRSGLSMMFAWPITMDRVCPYYEY